jgi:hypothetical protein
MKAGLIIGALLLMGCTEDLRGSYICSPEETVRVRDDVLWEHKSLGTDPFYAYNMAIRRYCKKVPQ